MSLNEYDFKKIGLFLAGLIIFIIAISGSVGTFYYLNKYHSSQKSLREASLTGQVDVKSLVDKVGKLIKLPDNETPTIATVSDLEKLKNQPFFAKAKIGDKVLLYPQNKKAVLYDPISNQIIEVGPLIIPTPTGLITQATTSADIAGLQTKASPSATLSVNVTLLNGTEIANLPDIFEKELIKRFPQISVNNKENAARKNYDKSVIVDVTGKNSPLAEEIANTLSLTVSDLPSEEKAPSGTDILIILASDR